MGRCPRAGLPSFSHITRTIMTEATENLEHAEHAHASGNKKLALLIAIRPTCGPSSRPRRCAAMRRSWPSSN